MSRKKSLKQSKKSKQTEQQADISAQLGRVEEEFSIPSELPVLPAKDMVAFPSVMMSLYIGRPGSLQALNESMEQDRLVVVVSQRNQDVDDPRGQDLFRVGVVAHVVRALQLPDGRHKVLLQGISRARVVSFKQEDQILRARLASFDEKPKKRSAQYGALMNRIKENLQLLVEREHLPEEMLLITEEVADPGVLADVILAHFKMDLSIAQAALEEADPLTRLKLADSMVTDDVNQFLLTEQIRDKTQVEMTKGQREYYLREQIKQIQRELGENDIGSDELIHLKERLESIGLPKPVAEESFKQFKRLERMSPESSEFALLRTYLDWIVELPWKTATKDRLELSRAKKILDEDHFGLDKVKDRILEYLSVRKLNKESRGSILCFVGPPGVGKTSLGKSIARALGRKFVRMSLGGVRDEAEIRGHRRTYVGALPGRILQGLKQAGSRNPVFILDELDKIGADFRGDPASGLLEVLDPHQNTDFRDHYLNVPYDLSDVLFIATANTIDTIPEALVDRLETIFIPGYTNQEKLKIAKRYVVPRQVKESGLEKEGIIFSDEALLLTIERYTREAGVRNLEREIAALCRKVAREVAEGKKPAKKITAASVTKMLGATKYDPELTEQKEDAGYVRGLAWTAQGGEVMPVEASIAAGNGTLHLTGQLGSVMQESAQAALFYARANASVLGLDPNFHSKFDIHVHVPGGATPKDGPSAGITIATAVVSALSGRKVAKDVAMTGEITLRGNILPVGGLREKALAALQNGITKVIIPFENVKDLDEIPEEQRNEIQFVPVKHVGEVLEMVLRASPPKRKEKKTSGAKKRKESRLRL